MLTDLRNGHEKSQEFPALKAILVGDKRANKRAQVGGGEGTTGNFPKSKAC